jgi:hypothetical protein
VLGKFLAWLEQQGETSPLVLSAPHRRISSLKRR